MKTEKNWLFRKDRNTTELITEDEKNKLLESGTQPYDRLGYKRFINGDPDKLKIQKFINELTCPDCCFKVVCRFLQNATKPSMEFCNLATQDWYLDEDEQNELLQDE